ncbi:MAG TPA: hypothetical protein VGO08_01355, partial [Burkholderiales bacterium]|nr:hypothetical protein [Burkholderiales bacterium]
MSETLKIPVESIDDPYSDFFAAAYDNQWTDGLPVIPPTPDRIALFIATVDRDPDEVVAVMPPRQGPATIRGIAANAVMAGCLPEYFPVVLAAVEAINDPGFPLATLVGMRPETPFFLVNGPVREKIALECGRGCLGPGWRANATIGRALRLIMINLGGLAPGTYARSCFASPLQYSFCAGEDEANSAWQPFHVERGYAREQSVVSVFRVTSYTALLAPLDWDQSPHGLLEHTGLSMGSPGNTAMYAGNLSCLLLFNHERVHLLAQAGISKEQAKAMLYEYSMLPTSAFRKGDLEALREKGRVIGDKVSLVDSPADIYIGV